MNNYNLQIKADSLQQQLESLQAQKKLLEEQLSNQKPVVQNNPLPSQITQYEFYGQYCDDIYNIKSIDEKVIYMDKDEPKFMMNGIYYKFEEFNPKSELQILKEENKKLKQQLKEAKNESIDVENVAESEQRSEDKFCTIPLKI